MTVGKIINDKRKKVEPNREKFAEQCAISVGILRALETKGKINDANDLFRIGVNLKVDLPLLFSKSEFNYNLTKLNYKIIKKDQNNLIEEVYCNSWESFLSYYHKNIFKNSSKHIWRGQKETIWKLESTLLREFPEGIDENIIQILISNFKRALKGKKEAIDIDHFHHTNPQNSNTNEEWLMLGQHYGLKTPLLDWTYTPFVASYFAYFEEESKSQYRVLYCLNKEFLEKTNSKEEVKILASDSHFNQRLLNQQGLFIYGPLEKDLEAWINDKIELEKIKEPLLYKIFIPNIERNNILKSLQSMNINPVTLFPDFSGAADYANLKIKIDSY